MIDASRYGSFLRNWAAWILLPLAVVVAALLVFPRPGGSQEILVTLSNNHLGEGRLFHASTPPDTNSSPDREALRKAQLQVLSLPDASGRQRIQSLIALLQNEAQQSVDLLSILHKGNLQSPDITNDLGVAHLALGHKAAVHYFTALKLFERAKSLAPTAPAPRFNIILANKLIGLGQEAQAEMLEFDRLERDRGWITALASPEVDEKLRIEELRMALMNKDIKSAQKLFQLYMGTYQHLATEYALKPPASMTTDPAVQFVANELENAHGDHTLAAMLQPLQKSNRERVIASRKLVEDGAEAYSRDGLSQSLQLFAKARTELQNIDSPFDNLWIDLRRADAEIRSQNYPVARQLLGHVIEESKRQHFRWLHGRALAALNSDLQLGNRYTDTLLALSEAADTLTAVGALEHAARPLYYLAIQHFMAGDPEASLNISMQGVKMVQRDDHLRKTQFFWLMAKALFRMNDLARAMAFQKRSVQEANATSNAPIIAAATSELASMYLANLDYDNAENYLSQARELTKPIKGLSRKNLEYTLNVLCGRLEAQKRRLAESAKCLQDNIDVITEEDHPLFFYLSQSMRLLAETHVLGGRVEDARKMFKSAVEVAEKDDEYIAFEKQRLSFDNERRDLYESAIAFEYDHDNKEGAWSYVQHYKSKLFLEFLSQTNPTIGKVRSDAVDRVRAQRLIPKDAQIVEYITLNNRLLIWTLSDKRFTSESVPIDRGALEGKIGDFLERIQREGDTTQLSEELYRLLIAPVERSLDRDRALVIIPDQSLHRLPYAALRTSDAYLVESYTLLESPSLTHLLAAQPGKPLRDSAVFFGSRKDETLITQELSDVEKSYGNKRNISGYDADKAGFLSAMNGASVFHYSGHSIDATDALRSAVLLDGNDVGPNSVTAADISQRHMRPNSVVVLASCDSSVGNSRDGVGLRGLTSAFLAGGAGSVVGSLWVVDAKSTSRLAVRFHENFGLNSLPVAQALREAQLSLLHATGGNAHPYYWSGFVVTGNSSALR